MGMAELLNQEDDFEVCAVAEDIVSARKAIIEFDPDLAIIAYLSSEGRTVVNNNFIAN